MNTAPPPDFALSQPEPRSAEITRKLLHYLLSGTVRPGQRIPSERQLASGLGVGRSAVREAVKVLDILGLVDQRQGDGTYLSEAQSDLLPRVIEWGLLLGQERTVDLVEAARHLDIVVAGLAASRRNEQDLKDLQALMDAMTDAIDAPDHFIEIDALFHQRLADAGGNTVLASLLASMRSLLRVWIARVAEGGAEDRRASLERHRAVLDALLAGDPERSRLAMVTHMRAVSE